MWIIWTNPQKTAIAISITLWYNFDILEKGEVITYREKEHDFLISIRNGYYLDENNQPTKEFYKIVDELEDKLNILSKRTDLPDVVDMKKVNDFVAEVNEKICNKELNRSVNKIWIEQK